jgi:DNA-binding transcriptional MerR regulator
MGTVSNLHSSDHHDRKSIAEASALSGLSASTIRFYEKEQVIPPVRRDEIGHRYFTSEDVDHLIGVACVAATGMPLADLKQYLHAGISNCPNPEDQKQLLSTQLKAIEREQEVARLRKRFVKAKLKYWDAVESHSDEAMKAATAHVKSAETLLTRSLISVRQSGRQEKKSMKAA